MENNSAPKTEKVEGDEGAVHKTGLLIFEFLFVSLSPSSSTKLYTYFMKKRLLWGLSAFFLGGCADESDLLTFQTPCPFRSTSRPYEIKGSWYYPQHHYELDETGVASYYGGRDGTHGLSTASGERFDMYRLTAAHKTLPLPCVALVTNLENGRMVKVKINDRGPFKNGRIIDLSARAAEALGFYRKGTAIVRVQTLPEESLLLPENVRALEKKGIHGQRFASAPVSPDPPVAVAQPLKTSLSPPFVAKGAGARAASNPSSHNIQSLIKSAELVRVPLPIPRDPIYKSCVYINIGNYLSYSRAKQELRGLRKIAKTSITKTDTGYFSLKIGPFKRIGDADRNLDKLIASGHKDARIVIITE